MKAPMWPAAAVIAMAGAVDLFALEGSDKALGLGVVVGIADPAHAGGDAVPVEHAGVLGTGVLHAAVGMVDQAAPGRAARRHRHGQRRHRQAGAEMIGHRPADDAPAESIEDNRQIGELLLEPGIEPAPAKAGVMSATHSWSRALSCMSRARFGTTGQRCRASVVDGTKGRRRRPSRLPRASGATRACG